METQREYEQREVKAYYRQFSEIEASLRSDRVEGYESLLDTCKNNPSLIAERIGWILNGSYGFGSCLEAHKLIRDLRNPNPAMFNMLAHIEYLTSSYYANKAYKALTKDQQKALNDAVTKEIEEYKAGEQTI